MVFHNLVGILGNANFFGIKLLRRVLGAMECGTRMEELEILVWAPNMNPTCSPKNASQTNRRNAYFFGTDQSSPQIVHWLTGRGLSGCLHLSIRRGKNEFITSTHETRHTPETCNHSQRWTLEPFDIHRRSRSACVVIHKIFISMQAFLLAGLRTSFSGWMRLWESTLRASILAIFLVTGFSRTIDKTLLLRLDDAIEGPVKADVDANTDARAKGMNFMVTTVISCFAETKCHPQ
jgi:hypothetical protein